MHAIGELGRALFAKTYGEVASHKAGAINRASIDSLEDKHVTRDLLESNKKPVTQQVHELGRVLGGAFQEAVLCSLHCLGWQDIAMKEKLSVFS